MSSSSQELSPRRKIGCGLFESNNTLSSPVKYSEAIDLSR